VSSTAINQSTNQPLPHTKRLNNRIQVFITPAAEVDDDDLVGPHCWGAFQGFGDGMA
jgi:hypothetical protein